MPNTGQGGNTVLAGDAGAGWTNDSLLTGGDRGWEVVGGMIILLGDYSSCIELHTDLLLSLFLSLIFVFLAKPSQHNYRLIDIKNIPVYIAIKAR